MSQQFMDHESQSLSHSNRVLNLIQPLKNHSLTTECTFKPNKNWRYGFHTTCEAFVYYFPYNKTIPTKCVSKPIKDIYDDNWRSPSDGYCFYSQFGENKTLMNMSGFNYSDHAIFDRQQCEGMIRAFKTYQFENLLNHFQWE